jgi:hypothetical protein
MTNEEVCCLYQIKFIWRESGKIENIGLGSLIYLDITSENSWIYQDPTFFYGIPNGIAVKGQILTRVGDILNFYNKNEGVYHTVKHKSSNSLSLKLNDENNLKFLNLNLTPDNIQLIEKKFSVCFELWSKKLHRSKDLFKNIYTGNVLFKSNLIMCHFQSETCSIFLVSDRKKYMSNFLCCKNKKFGCKYQFDRRDNVLKHEELCKTVKEAQENPKIIQVAFGFETNSCELAVKHKFIKENTKNSNFIFYDCETLMQPDITVVGQSEKRYTHQLVSIAANSFINGLHTQKIWIVKNSSLEAQDQIVDGFVKFCLAESSRMTLDTKIKLSVSTLLERLESKELGDLSVTECQSILFFLRSLQKLSILGYNSSKYDLCVMFKQIVKSYVRITDDTGLDIIKKGSKYFSVMMGSIWFKDLLNYGIPCSLDNYLKTWGKGTSKYAFPYERFSSIEEIKQCLTFPDKHCFDTILNGEIDEELYVKSKKIYDHYHGLPTSHRFHWPNFESYLSFYNLSDVVPTALAMITQFDVFEKNFKLYPLQYFGLPGYSKCVMYKLYDRKCPKFFSFSDNTDALFDFRKNIIGGLVNVMLRHVSLTAEPAAKAAKFNCHGKRWRKISFYDINAQYPR